MKRLLLCLSFLLFSASTYASYLLVPMDEGQKNHLKAYGLTYWILQNDIEADWLLNYRGGSFMVKYYQKFENEALIRGISYEVISDAQASQIIQSIASPANNMDLMKLQEFPKIAVYSPKNKLPWDDAVTLVLTYAEIPYDVVFDDEVMTEGLAKYDWLHLHHEDFTGQYGKFYSNYKYTSWYQEQKRDFEATAKRLGFNKVSELKRGVALEIRNYVLGGGFLFAMCSATDSYDIALAAMEVDIVDAVFDGDSMDPQAQQKLNYENTFAFKDFQLVKDPNVYEFSDIDSQHAPKRKQTLGNGKNDFFTLFDFSAKWDPVPTMLTQNHEKIIKGFAGQTTAFKKKLIKSDVLILGETEAVNDARYIHGVVGKGFWTFFGGHDPEDYEHRVGEEPTDLNLHPNSPGYRLILNNILFPAAKKKKQKT